MRAYAIYPYPNRAVSWLAVRRPTGACPPYRHAAQPAGRVAGNAVDEGRRLSA
jgi:hypothetical protein